MIQALQFSHSVERDARLASEKRVAELEAELHILRQQMRQQEQPAQTTA
jgi:hypothetical protein